MKSWTTQASKDDGVDAITVNEDPIFGGLCVIQAKRYRSAVGIEQCGVDLVEPSFVVAVEVRRCAPPLAARSGTPYGRAAWAQVPSPAPIGRPAPRFSRRRDPPLSRPRVSDCAMPDSRGGSASCRTSPGRGWHADATSTTPPTWLSRRSRTRGYEDPFYFSRHF